MEYMFTLTDTFNGESNFSWVKRFEGNFKSDRAALRAASRHFGLQGLLVTDGADRWSIRGACMVLFLEATQ